MTVTRDSHFKFSRKLRAPIMAQRVGQNFLPTYCELDGKHLALEASIRFKAALTRQMGTNLKMMEQHYSHLDTVRKVEQLRGEDSQTLLRDHTQLKKRYAYNLTQSWQTRNEEEKEILEAVRTLN